MPLLQLCHEYGIDPLKEECGNFLFSNSEQVNVAYLLGTRRSPAHTHTHHRTRTKGRLCIRLDVADKHGIKKLEKRCAEYLASNFSDFIESDDRMLMQLKTSTWLELVQSDEIEVTRYCADCALEAVL
jgi:hypothetical protein